MNTKGSEFNVGDFGAAGDGVTLDQEAIQRAVDACHEAGGGRVYVPPGCYLSGTIQLRSHVCFYLDMGARLLAATDGALFPEICKTPYGNLPGQIQALLFADKAENIVVAGYGAIDGGGDSALAPEDAATVFFRPALVFFRDCRQVRFLDVSLQNSTFWTLHLLRCNDVMVRGCTITGHPERINVDGIDPDGCQNVIISDCRIDTGDDCIVVKSTEGDLCRNITISNCTLRSSQAALKIGTEGVADIRDITFTNCVVFDSNVALALFMKDGSVYENIIFSNMVIEASHDFPIVVDHTPRYHKEPKYGRIRNVMFDTIFIRGKGRCYLEGDASYPLENITFRNITWTVTGECRYKGARKPPGARRIDPDPEAVSYAEEEGHIVAVHVKDLTLEQFTILYHEGVPARKALFAHNITDAAESKVVI